MTYRDAARRGSVGPSAGQDLLTQVSMLTAVLFDLFETLITESGVQATRASSLAPTLGLEDDAYRKEWKLRRPSIVRGQMSFAEALTEISQTVIGRADEAAIQGICQQRIREKTVAYAQIRDELAALVTTLARRGVGLAVISNGFAEDVLGWSRCSLADEISCTAFSCAEHIAKPDPEIYQRALLQLGVDPAAAMYIGDGGDDELGGAERAGLRAYRAAWFIRNSPQKAIWPALTDPKDILEIVAAG
jgi:putative hydrolase of the HAD superfamily